VDLIRIASLARFIEEREPWEQLYRADPLAQTFLSWSWLRAALPIVHHRWFIVALTDADQLVAALPLAMRAIPSRALPIASELIFATDPVADYQGLLCRSGREDEALQIFAAEITRLRWDRVAFGDVADPRVASLLDLLKGERHVRVTVGQTRCLSVALPRDWESYAASLNRNSRQQNARRLRQLEAVEGYRLTAATSADLELHIEALLRMRHQRWGGSLARARAKYGRLFREAHHTGALRLIAMWADSRPIAACASFVDPVQGTYGFYQIGNEREFARWSPGKLLVAIVIRDAIELGYRVFDFLRGDEAYKHVYASTVTVTKHHRITRRSLRTAVFDAVQPSYRALKVAAVRVVYGRGRIV
jgi:CelD/BcsL family acetyltransferase involved in cellulose biosynthesis